jgi:hypothetical protein
MALLTELEIFFHLPTTKMSRLTALWEDPLCFSPFPEIGERSARLSKSGMRQTWSLVALF